jgi:hypothetical protein
MYILFSVVVVVPVFGGGGYDGGGRGCVFSVCFFGVFLFIVISGGVVCAFVSVVSL